MRRAEKEWVGDWPHLFGAGFFRLSSSPRKEEIFLLSLSKHGEFKPVTYKIFAAREEWLQDPIALFALLVGDQSGFLLESAEGPQKLARYTIIGWAGNEYVFNHGGRKELTKLLKKQRLPLLKELEPFYNGFVGCISFDLSYREEKHRLNNYPTKTDLFGFPGAILLDPRYVVILDRQERLCKVVVNGAGGSDSLEEIIRKLENPWENQQPAHGQVGRYSVRARYSKFKFEQMVRQVKDYIAAGDVFQVVLSQPFYGPTQLAPLTVYRNLRQLNPSPYHYFLQLGGYHIIGSSPEMLVRVKGGQVETRPIAGTRPRGKNTEEDKRIAAELLGDDKERAEHLMLVDLGRNDIGRVARPGSVKLKDFYHIEKYSHVMHLVSSVQGQLAAEVDSIDAFWACFPAGTVSGAPKVRALEIIHELELEGRGLYAGAIGYFSAGGDLDTCIAIRTIVMNGQAAQVRVGAGIVADSDPEREYMETIHKGNAMFKALGWEVKFDDIDDR